MIGLQIFQGRRIVSVGKIVALLIAGTITSLLSPIAESEELPTNGEIAQLGRSLFENGKYAELDALTTEYRQKHSVTREGYLRLYQLYAEFSHCPDDDRKYSGLESSAAEWMAASPKSPTAIVIASKFKKCRASAVRGEGFALTVPKAAMKRFHRFLEQARVILDGGEKVASVDPGWYSEKISVGMGQSADKRQIISLARRGLAIEPGFLAIIYDAYRALLDRWGGDKLFRQDLLKVMDEVKDSEVRAQNYARLAYYVAKNFGEDEMKENFNPERVGSGYEVILKKYPVPQNFSYAAAMACFLEDRTRLPSLIAKIGTKPVVRGFFDDQEYLDYCIKLAQYYSTGLVAPGDYSWPDK
jgi:hypothetical protein